MENDMAPKPPHQTQKQWANHVNNKAMSQPMHAHTAKINKVPGGHHPTVQGQERPILFGQLPPHHPREEGDI